MFTFFSGTTPNLIVQILVRGQDGSLGPADLAALGQPVQVVLLGPQPQGGGGVRQRLVRAATFVTDGSDGQIQYQCVPTDLPPGNDGQWQIFGEVVGASQNYVSKPGVFMLETAP